MKKLLKIIISLSWPDLALSGIQKAKSAGP